METPTYENRSFMIFSVSEINKINFNTVLETSADTLRKSIDGTKTFVKWEGTTPAWITTLTSKEGPYTYSEMMTILSTSAWSTPQNGLV